MLSICFVPPFVSAKYSIRKNLINAMEKKVICRLLLYLRTTLNTVPK